MCLCLPTSISHSPTVFRRFCPLHSTPQPWSPGSFWFCWSPDMVSLFFSQIKLLIHHISRACDCCVWLAGWERCLWIAVMSELDVLPSVFFLNAYNIVHWCKKRKEEIRGEKSLCGCPGVRELRIVALLPALVCRSPRTRQVKYFPCRLYIPVTHIDTHKQSPLPLTPVQFSQAFTPESHCFELTALPHWVQLQGVWSKEKRGEKKLNGEVFLEGWLMSIAWQLSALWTLSAVVIFIPRQSVCGQNEDELVVSPACHQVVVFGKQ